jgi:hypothetical protein
LRDDRTHEFLVPATVSDLDIRLSTLVDDLEWEIPDIGLHLRIGKFTTNETLSVEDTGQGDQFVDRLIRRQWWRTDVLCGFTAVWFFAASPIRRSVSEKETQEGVVLLPWSLGMISTWSFRQTPTQLCGTR